MTNYANLFILLINVIFALAAVPDDESCHSYAGGTVYPLGANPETSEHKLQWTKAVSKCPIFEILKSSVITRYYFLLQ